MSDIGANIEQVAVNNPRIADMIEDLIVTALLELERDLKLGDSKARSEAMKLIMGHAMKAKEQANTNRMDEIANEMRDLLRETVQSAPDPDTA